MDPTRRRAGSARRLTRGRGHEGTSAEGDAERAARRPVVPACRRHEALAGTDRDSVGCRRGLRRLSERNQGLPRWVRVCGAGVPRRHRLTPWPAAPPSEAKTASPFATTATPSSRSNPAGSAGCWRERPTAPGTGPTPSSRPPSSSPSGPASASHPRPGWFPPREGSPGRCSPAPRAGRRSPWRSAGTESARWFISGVGSAVQGSRAPASTCSAKEVTRLYPSGVHDRAQLW